MQQRALAVFAFLIAHAAAAKVSTENTAKAWLESHRSPTDDQLGQLKNANPDAYAMVKALLTKHSMGLVKLDASQRGPDVFRNMMTPRHLAPSRPQLDVPYADAQVVASPSVDNMHYDAKAAADKDEMMVDRLLGAVAGLSGAKGKKIALLRKRNHKQQVEDPFAQDMAAFGVAPTTQAPAVLPAVATDVEQQQQPAAPAHHANSYLKDIDLSGDMPTVRRPKHTVMKHEPNQDSDANDLASFSFGDAVAQAEAEEAPKPKKVVAPKPKKQNSFLKYLGLVKEAPAPQEAQAVPAQPVKKHSNGWVDFLK